MGSKLPPGDAELYRRVDEVLHYLWDPIGVAGTPWARDEYYSHLPQIFRLVKEGATSKEMARHLTQLARGFGVNPQRKRAEEVADILVEYQRWAAEREAAD